MAHSGDEFLFRNEFDRLKTVRSLTILRLLFMLIYWLCYFYFNELNMLI